MKSLLKNNRIATIAQDFAHKLAKRLPIMPAQRPCVLELINQLPQLIWVITPQKQHIFNQALCHYVNLDLNILPPETCLDFIHPEDHQSLLDAWHAAQQHPHSFEQTCRLRNAEHQYYWFKISVHYQPRSSFEWLFSCQDIHEQIQDQQQLQEQLCRQKNILNASHDCIKVLSPEGKLIYINDFGRGCLCIPKEHLLGFSWLDLLSDEERIAGQRALAQANQGQVSRFTSTSQNGHLTKHWDNVLTPVSSRQHHIKQILCVSRDVSQQILIEQHLEYVNSIDDLTQLYNRKAFNQLLEKTISQAEITQSNVGLLILDVDYFKHLNDTLGHLAGDHLLRVFAERLRKCFAEPILMSRFGNDEFAIVLPQLQAEHELIHYAELALKQLEAPIRYAGQYINSGMSIGCAIYPTHATESAHLIRCADTALSELKHNGHGGVLMFNQQMLDTLEHTVQELNLARDLIRRDALVPYYQPKINLITQKVIGFEALLRWRTPQGQIQFPASISEAFRDYELATRISESMQHKIFQDLAAWIEQGIDVQPISINAAPVEFLRDNYAETLLERLMQYQIPHHLIEIEITEQSLAERGAPYVLRALKCLKEMGIRIALDDFGTGHSSLTRLKDYPVDILKIDRTFVEQMHNDLSIMAIVKAICQLGPTMHLSILAEGIEQLEHVSTLKACECALGQGFYFYRPMPAASVCQLLGQTA
jgi:diguanylate cyclase (GGDEF)-like protein